MADLGFDLSRLATPTCDAEPIAYLQAIAAERSAALAQAALGRFLRHATALDAAADLCPQLIEMAFVLKDGLGADGPATLCDPAFCHWIKGAYRLAEDAPAKRARWLRHGADFLWPFMRDRGAFSWRTGLDDAGGLRCLPGKRYLEFGADRAFAEIEIRSDPGDRYFHIAFADGMIAHVPFEDVDSRSAQSAAPTIAAHGFALNTLPTLADGRITFGYRDPALRVRFTGTHQRATGVDFFDVSTAIMDPSADASRFDDAIALLADLWPEAGRELSHLVRVIVPVRSPTPETRLAFTVSSRQGAVFLEACDDHALLHNLAHETAHIKLRHLQLLDPMMDGWDDETRRFAVPWRADKRPLAGIFEGVFVFAHVLALEQRMLAGGQVSDPAGSARMRRDINAAASILFEHAPLTAAGRELVETVCAWGEVRTPAAMALTA